MENVTASAGLFETHDVLHSKPHDREAGSWVCNLFVPCPFPLHPLPPTLVLMPSIKSVFLRQREIRSQSSYHGGQSSPEIERDYVTYSDVPGFTAELFKMPNS